MRYLVLVVLAALWLTGCAGSSVPSASTEPSSLAASSSVSPSIGPTPNQAAETSSPVPTATPTPLPSPEAEALERCVAEGGRYAVSYPADWFSNAGIADWDDCGLFDPAPFATWDDQAISVRLLAQPYTGWNDPYVALTQEIEGITILADELSSIGGRRAWMREFEMTQTIPGSRVAGERQLTYDIELPDGWFLHADLISGPEAFEAERAVFEAMLERLEAFEVPEP